MNSGISQFTSEIALTFPDYVCQSAWLTHGPFAFWLIEKLQPKNFVELGTHLGYSYFAACQAVKEVGCNTKCYAIDEWRGDVHAGFYGNEVFHQVNFINNARYSAFSRLIKSSFEKALTHFSDNSIDLLHIDGRHYYDDVKYDFESWKPKLTSNAIVLFHDTNVRERNFGVFKFWEELKAQHPSFEFYHGHGLGILATGTVPEALKELLALSPDSESAVALRKFYAALGDRIANEWRLQQEVINHGETVKRLDAEIKNRDEKIRTLAAENSELKSNLERIVNSPLWKTFRIGKKLIELPLNKIGLNKHLANLPDKFKNISNKAYFNANKSKRWETELVKNQQKLASHTEPLISVIMPTKNRLKVIPTAIQSVLDQTYKNWELIIVDDDSNDGTLEALQLKYNDPRIKLLSCEGSGVCAARNTGLQAAKGEYIAYLDSDNSWTENYLKYMLYLIQQSGTTIAYAAQKRVGDAFSKTKYLQRKFNYESLMLFNYIDLNVFFHHRKLIEEKGLFDTSLKRMVDWEFILRLTKDSEVSFANFIGCIYNDSSAPDRITNSESLSYQNVIRNKYLINWDELKTNLEKRSDQIVSIIICVYGQIELTQQCLKSLYEHEAGQKFEVILVNNRHRREDEKELKKITKAYKNIKLITNPENFNFALGNNIGFSASTGTRVVFLNNDTEVSPEWLRALVSPLQDENVMGAQPKLLYPDRSIQGAGIVFSKFSPIAYPIYLGQPADFFPTLNSRNYSALTAACFAIRAADFIKAQGFDPIYTNGQEDIDLCLRLGNGKPVFRYVADSLVIHHEGQSAGRGRFIKANRKIFVERWKDLIQADDFKYYQLDKLKAEDYEADNIEWAEKGFAVWKPKLNVLQKTLQISSALKKKVIAIKIPCPKKELKDHWGDYHFAVALAAALIRSGANARIDFLNHWSSASENNDINLVLRGLSRFKPDNKKLNLLWLISHPDKVTLEELQEFQHNFVASSLYTKHLSSQGLSNVESLLQCTDASRFNPELYDASYHTANLFVANSRKILRSVVKMAVAENAALDIYGEMWDGLAPQNWVKAEKIDNVLLPKYYASAEVVLNDHWQSMKDYGFVSNRIFDALACGASVVTDTVADFPEDLLPGCFFFDQDTPLTAVLEQARRNPAEPTLQQLQLAEYVRSQHSFDARAKRIIAVIEELL